VLDVRYFVLEFPCFKFRDSEGGTIEIARGFTAQGSGFRVQGSGFRAQGPGFRVQGSGFEV